MREATLGGLSDLDTMRPRRPGPSRGKTPGQSGKGKPAPGRGAFGRLRSRATLIIATAGFSAIMVGIVVNAVVMQKGHHPAPLFGAVRPDAPPAPHPAPRPEAAPVSMVAPVPMAAPVTAAAPIAEAVPTAPPPATPLPRATAPAAPRQPLKRIVHHTPPAAAKPQRVAARPVDRIAGLIDQAAEVADPHAPLALHPIAMLRGRGATGAKVRPGQKSSLVKTGSAHKPPLSPQAPEKKA